MKKLWGLLSLLQSDIARIVSSSNDPSFVLADVSSIGVGMVLKQKW